jgi:hypothetical protein
MAAHVGGINVTGAVRFAIQRERDIIGPVEIVVLFWVFGNSSGGLHAG